MFSPSINAEPIPGYTLVEKLGAGGYGEVWKAQAPGGLYKAIKFIFGKLDESRAGQESKAIHRMKSVRHPFLLSIERVEILDGQLIIVTELAERTLTHRFEECHRSGLPGIPRNELLSIMRDAADALDYMSEIYSLQHLDIKPGNLLMVGGRVKVADFGLVKDLGEESVTVTGGVSPAYAPAELFDGHVSRYSDQYSLAIVYQEMLTGCRPFPGTTAFQLALQHSAGKPMIGPLPAADRPIIARALSRDPNERFPSCNQFVQALASVNATSSSGASKEQIPIIGSPPQDDATDPDALHSSEIGIDDTTTAHLDSFATPLLQLAESNGPLEAGSSSFRSQPTLFLGIGGLGISTIRHLRSRLLEALGEDQRPANFSVLGIDSDRKELQAASTGNTTSALHGDEWLHVPLHRPEHYRSRQPEILRWLDRRWFFGIPKSLETEGLRPLGRLAFVDNAPRIREAIQSALISLNTPHPGNQNRSSGESPSVVIVSSINGGTGGGFLTDLHYLIHDVLTDLNMKTDVVQTILLHATSPKPAEKELARANAYATLLELNSVLHPDSPYFGDEMMRIQPRNPQGDIVRDCYVIHLGDNLNRDEAREATQNVAEYLFLSSATSMRTHLSQYRQDSHRRPLNSQSDAFVRTFGMYKLQFDRKNLVNVASRICTRHLLARWHGDFDPASDARQQDEGGNNFSYSFRSRWLKDLGESDSLQILGKLELNPEQLISYLDTTSTMHFHGNPQRFCQSVVNDIISRYKSNKNLSDTSAQVFQEVDNLLGEGMLPSNIGPIHRSDFEKRVREAGREYGDSQASFLEEWVRTTVGNPQKRIKPVFVGLEGIIQNLLCRLERIQALFAGRQRERIALRSRLLGKDFGIQDRQRGKPPSSLSELTEMSLTYCAARLHEISVECMLEAIRIVYKRATEIRQRLVEVRQQIVALSDKLVIEATQCADPSMSKVPSVEHLLPGSACNVQEAAIHLAKALSTTAFYEDLDEKIDDRFLLANGGLWGLLKDDSLNIESLSDRLSDCVQESVLASVEKVDAASIFFASHREMSAAIKEIARMTREGRPSLLEAGGWSEMLLGVPNSPSGRSFRELVAAQLASESVSAVASPGDIIFCCEGANIPLSQLALTVIDQEPAYAQAGLRLVTRRDVQWLRFPTSGQAVRV